MRGAITSLPICLLGWHRDKCTLSKLELRLFAHEVQEYEMWCGVGKTPYCIAITNCSVPSDSVYGQKV